MVREGFCFHFPTPAVPTPRARSSVTHKNGFIFSGVKKFFTHLNCLRLSKRRGGSDKNRRSPCRSLFIPQGQQSVGSTENIAPGHFFQPTFFLRFTYKHVRKSLNQLNRLYACQKGPSSGCWLKCWGKDTRRSRDAISLSITIAHCNTSPYSGVQVRCKSTREKFIFAAGDCETYL